MTLPVLLLTMLPTLAAVYGLWYSYYPVDRALREAVIMRDLDAGKAVAMMAGQAGSLWDYEDVGDNWSRVDAAGIAPVVAVPTTAGTGSVSSSSSSI